MFSTDSSTTSSSLTAGGGGAAGAGAAKVSFVKRGVELISTLDNLLAEGTVESESGQIIKKLHVRTDLAEYITRTLIGLEELAVVQQNAKAQHTAENIQQRLQQVKSLHIYSPHTSLNLHFFKLSYYCSLEELFLEDCPPSLAVDLYLLRKCLFKIRMVQSGITCLGDVLAPVKNSIRHSLSPMIFSETTILSLPKKYYWRNVTSLTLSNCGLSRIDEALHFFPCVTYLNLSHNTITHLTHLHDCIALQVLDVSFNKIRVLSNLERVLGKIKGLILHNNEIESIDGIDKIYSLEHVDISTNFISDLNEIQHLCRLPCLESILIFGNPLCEKKHYRLRIYREFLNVGSIMSGNRQFPVVDGREIRKKELKKLRRLLFRSPTDSMVESSYASHYSPYMDIDFDEMDSDTMESSDAEEAFESQGRSRLSIGAVSPLAVDAFRRLSTGGRSRSTATFSPTKRSSIDRRTSVERMRSSEYFGKDAGLGLRQSLVGKKFIKKIAVREKRRADISNGEVKDVYPTLTEIEEDMVLHADLWIKHDPVDPKDLLLTKSESVSVCSDTPINSTLTSPKREQTGIAPNADFASLPGSLELPSQLMEKEHLLQSPSKGIAQPGDQSPLPTMDAFIGRINENTEFKGYNGTTNRSLLDVNSSQQPAPVQLEGEYTAKSNNFSESTTRQSMGGRESLVGRESIMSRISDLPYDPMGFHRQSSQDSILLEVDPYVGDAQYRSLSVLDNLELYFREQVFPSNRPSFPNLYLRQMPTNPNDHSLNLINPYAPEERFTTLFFEKIIDLKDPMISIKSSYNVEDAPLLQGSKNKSSPANFIEYQAKETYVAIVLTDMGFYIVDLTDVSPKLVFADSPLLAVQKHFPLYKLSLLTIYFGFQRCALGFLDDPTQTDSRSVSDMMAAYMVVTRDKSHTYPIITRLPQVSNIQRNARKPKPLSNVRIENKDGQLLEQLHKFLGTQSDNDINHYQMVYQINTKRPGWRAPRSIILTKNMLLLCNEDLSSVNVKLTVLDSSQVKDVHKIYHEENPLFVTFVFKRTGVLSAKRKWRVFCDARPPSTKLLEECRRACQDAGNTDV